MRGQTTTGTSSSGCPIAEAAFYDAVVQNDAAVLEMGDDTLKKIAVDLVEAVQPERDDRLEPQGVGARRHARQGAAAARQVRLPARPRGEGRRARP